MLRTVVVRGVRLGCGVVEPGTRVQTVVKQCRFISLLLRNHKFISLSKTRIQ